MLTTVFLSLGCCGRHALPVLGSDFPLLFPSLRPTTGGTLGLRKFPTQGQLPFLVFVFSQPPPRAGGARSGGGRHCISRGAVKSHRRSVFQARRRSQLHQRRLAATAVGSDTASRQREYERRTERIRVMSLVSGTDSPSKEVSTYHVQRIMPDLEEP